ncbi:(p)ppGpp synthetase I, SpoT/RelA [Spirochaeta thermophila DSM 6578]|uniref:(P)ppGpp synthetase I, SpoT/RelA n=1 Tax=Winmispira thermophila (strain ATCC 700085 / DSM 6578 / Z-1203) TaxID=869211 RepID=G0GDV4_WINT7|nr:bifunctional (p)ppGpp synthetase/guanosine-3',5'-bis(diphosphate) 3'-pyrophosphohydrolase [Spirochaeta thermophila]AEJ62234.1 (p)ppGpp synthetase I, SpoT/RelA [Spirochaeta thermophila DSM 6578]
MSPALLIDRTLTPSLGRYTDEEKARVQEAARWAAQLHEGQLRASGEPYISHPLEVARILADLGMDTGTLIAALLHDTIEDTGATRDEIASRFGEEVALLVEGVTKISSLRARNRKIQAAESIRKMLLAMAKDIRVILIKLADKLHNMRTLQYLPPAKQKAIATECLEIYAPLAERLGMSSLKDELEDLALKHLQPEVYAEIEHYVNERIEARTALLEEVARTIKKEAGREGIKVEIQMRRKHLYSIYQKMKRKARPLEEIYDVLGIRLLCNTETECYTLLGIVHRLYKPLEGRFKDYIAMPKANRYQSLHTTVMVPGGTLVEVQIRTHQMHRTAEYGIAAHWLYKEGISPHRVDVGELSIINRLREWSSLKATSGQFLEEIKQEILRDSIYVFTPKGDVIELPKGATPIDFAYHIHTDIGDHLAGAKANGAIIPITAELQNTQVVEIITSPHAHPHIGWLRAVKTARARSKIRAWINRHDTTYLVEKNVVVKKPSGPSPPPSPPRARPGEALREEKKIGIRVGTERNLLVRFARCCHPVTGDDIVGYVSRGRGIIIHRRDCPNLSNIEDFARRQIEVEWESISPRTTWHVRVRSRHTGDLFSEVEGAIRKLGGHLIEGKITEQRLDEVDSYFSLEVDRKEQVRRVLKAIRAIPSVKSVSLVE